MSELLPTVQAEDIHKGLLDYLTTTFALADPEARGSLTEFLGDPQSGIFKGPYVRLRLPFEPASEGWERSLDWHEGFPPYGHQAAAFERLSSANLSNAKSRPLPTLVTTGTGSGKTEAFLYPILDHVLRAKRNGEQGIKALILYPMNALANDQARRLAQLISSSSALGGVRAALYTGQKGGLESSLMSADGLITKREAIRQDPPDILLTNYKMLDQLLLRTADQGLWHKSATSLRYLVLDEFHTYDGAQGTDVSMLLRRLGLALKRGWPAEHQLIDEAARDRPLGLVTPVATSATMGDSADPQAMMRFAETVFGEEFDAGSVITETRLHVDAWAGSSGTLLDSLGLRPKQVDNLLVNALVAQLRSSEVYSGDAMALTTVVSRAFYEGWSSQTTELMRSRDPDLLLALGQGHPFIRDLIQASSVARSIDELADELLPGGLSPRETFEERALTRRDFMVAVLGALSHIRYVVGRRAPSVDLHLWIRALNRINRVASPSVRFAWDDDGYEQSLDNGDPFSSEGRPQFPAVYCRHCGRSGWGVELAPTGSDLSPDDTDIRHHHAAGASRFRALIYAPAEADHGLTAPDEIVNNLAWFRVRDRAIAPSVAADEADLHDGWVLPVLALSGDDADDESRDDTCPSCERVDGIRFVGSAIATMLSVSITTIFGSQSLDGAEKKALVFTDSVQDAAHRAGFVQSRSHVFGFRNAIRAAVGDFPISLDSLVDVLLQQAGDDPFDRYRLLSPEIADNDNFRAFWQSQSARAIPAAVLRRVRKRLLLDVELEFGLQSRVGRTLELTGSVAAEVDAGTASKLETIGRSVLAGFTREGEVGELEAAEVFSDTVVRWVRGVLERMRDRGAIEHDWFHKYIENDGERWAVWGGRPKGEGMPAFPKGRDAPGYPRVGGVALTKTSKSQLDVVGSAGSWFAIWARKNLRVTGSDGAKLSRLLLAELEKQGVLSSRAVSTTGAVAYQLTPSRITVTPIADIAFGNAVFLAECDMCKNPITGTPQVIDQLADGPCIAARCPGTLKRVKGESNYYRTMYNDGDMRRVVAREHTGLLEDSLRLAYENGFKASVEVPDAPNVLVATPTLEMGIDIGDLSTVMLAGLPRSVASYLQRVGRAGRLTGNSLSLAFVVGRGEQLPKLGDPSSVINGEVRPPATYLEAREILQRQFFAYLVDRRATIVKSPPKRARDVLKSAEPGSFLGDLIVDLEADYRPRVDEFLQTFATLSEPSQRMLREWATPLATPGTSGVAHQAFRAVQKWNRELDLLKHRKQGIEHALDELEKAASHPAATEDAKSEYRSALATLRLVKRLLGDLRDDPWVGALERFGMLPNYTLLDDSVRLDVSLSWIDPDSGQFEHEGVSYERGASVAISELAPGAVFYAQATEITVDAVDLGIGGEAVRSWAYCASCGYAHDLAVATVPTSCPRCGGKAIADAAQRFEVVELEQVSAEVRRDEAGINDRRDDRERVRFTVFPTVDIVPTEVAEQWFVEGTDFGLKYVRDLTIRWLNVGKTGGYGQKRFIAGEERPSTLFRVCKECGKLDTSTGSSSRREHRPWCSLRTSKSENVASIVLSRVLNTQGVLLRLPPFLTVGDSLAVPSLSAAIQLGMREIIGGDPDHLNVISTVEPVLSDGGDNIPALLIHDTVPGGTGYLAELADPDHLRRMLERAWYIVNDCPCAAEGRPSCHRCVLPYAPGGHASMVSRASAQRSLETLLGIDTNGGLRPWVISKTEPPPSDPSSAIESYFRDVFIKRAKALGASVKEIPGDWGNKVQVTFPSSRRVWMLRPQVPLGATTPDFVLEQHGGGVTPIAIYTDGLKFHASPLHNRIADDAYKRRGARDQGYHVLGLTWPDVERAMTETPEPALEWFSKEIAGAFTGQYGISMSALDHVSNNPVTQLMEWMQDPDTAAARWLSIARALPIMALQPLGAFVPLENDSLSGTADLLLRGLPWGGEQQSSSWHLTLGHVTLVSRLIEGTKIESVLVLDDRDVTVAAEGFARSWRTWLRLSNLLLGESQIFAMSELRQADGPDAVKSTPVLHGEWAGLLTQATSVERTVLEALAADGAVPVPALGLELGDGIPVSFVWQGHKLAAAAGLTERDVAELGAFGWRVVDLDVSAIKCALAGK